MPSTPRIGVGLLEGGPPEDPQDVSDPRRGEGRRADAASAVQKRKLRAVPSVTLVQAAEAWLEGAKRGVRARILPYFAAVKLADVRHSEVRRFAERLRDRRALELEEAARLLEALPVADRALWATAVYGGLRRGELRALRWTDVDLGTGEIHVCRGRYDKEGPIEPKSRKRTRDVPIPAVLRDHLDEHKLRTRRDGEDSSSARRPSRFESGLSPERIGDYVGHSSAYMTDRYRHLLEGHRAEAAQRFAAYLERANTRARLAQLT